MADKRLAAPFILIVVLSGIANTRAQTTEPAQAPEPTPSSAPFPKIASKDPDYLKLLNPPKENAFLQTYSKSYRDELAEAEAKVADITDDTLRNKALNDEWAKVLKIDGDKFIYEAEVGLRDAKIAFSQKHRDGWYDAGRVYYDENNSVLAMVTNSTSTTPIDASFRFPMKAATLNQVYDRFHQIAAEEIDRKAHEYVSKSGEGSNCSRNPDWCLPIARLEIEKAMRSERIVVVAPGDPQTARMDHFLLVDSGTETILMDLNAPGSTVSSATWRFSIGPVPVMPKPAEAEAQPIATEPIPVTVRANVTPASVIEQVNPEYPPQARAANVEGEVVLRATIDKEGKISDVQVLAGDELLSPAAVEAVRKWRYKPMTVDGEAKEVKTTITVTFSMKE